MSLTLGGGPLARDAPDTVNYTIESPRRALYLHPFPRRVRARVGDRTVLDTRRGALLHETSLLPVLYAPEADLDTAALRPSDHTTHCPYKGDAAYWHLTVGGRTVQNAVWSYPSPIAETIWLQGLYALDWDAADAWLDEDERVEGHLRDPFHRVDVRRSSAWVRVTHGDTTVALTGTPMVLSENGLPNRYYLPPGDVRRELLEPSATSTYCPYKGRASYWNLRISGRVVPDVAWSYPGPLKDAHDVRDHLCFLHEELAVTGGNTVTP